MVMDEIVQEASGSTEWEISVGKMIIYTAIFYLQVIVVLEVFAYTILFKHLHAHNKNMKERMIHF